MKDASTPEVPFDHDVNRGDDDNDDMLCGNEKEDNFVCVCIICEPNEMIRLHNNSNSHYSVYGRSCLCLSKLLECVNEC